MTATVERTNGHRPDVTVGEQVAGCVRAPQNPSQASNRPDSDQGSVYTPVHTRAISQVSDIRPPRRPSKIRNFLSPHVKDVKAAWWGSWFGTEQPPAFYTAARQVLPADGEATNWAVGSLMTVAGLLRLVGLAACYLAAFCFATRIRATTATALLVAAGTVHHFTN